MCFAGSDSGAAGEVSPEQGGSATSSEPEPTQPAEPETTEPTAPSVPTAKPEPSEPTETPAMKRIRNLRLHYRCLFLIRSHRLASGS